MTTLTTSRRGFLKSTSTLGGGLFISFFIPTSAKKLAGIFEPSPKMFFAPNAFLRVGTDGVINVILAHAEMGQGIWTTLAMLIAEELDADWKAIKVEHCPAEQVYNHTAFGIQITGGSSSTWSEFDRYRQAGATARVLLVEAAAKKIGVNVADCKTENGFVISGTKKIAYAELAELASSIAVPAKVELRKPSEWKYIGKGAKRLDAPEKVNGSAVYGMDVHFPGMLTALVAHAPVPGGKLKSFDATAAKAVKGVRDIVQIPTGVAVIADHFWAAKKGRAALKLVWDNGDFETYNTDKQIRDYQALAKTKGLPAEKKGDTDAGMQSASSVVEGEYYFPYLAHAPMEPLNCTVKISNDGCQIWTGTQLPGVDQAAAAKILGLKNEQVKLETVFLGGGFGRRATPSSDFVSEAVHIAKASGKFIKMVWTREDDMTGGYYRPAFLHKVKVGLNADGYPQAWQHEIVGQSIMEGTMFAGMIKDGIDEASVEGIAGSAYFESVKDLYVGLHSTKLPVTVLWYRSVGNTHTAYVMETMIDEMATKTGKDPLEYRRHLLRNKPRHLAALNLAAEKGGYGKPLPAGHFQGIAVHESFKSFVGQVVEISLSETGQPIVHRVTCAIDCGLAVNPDGVKAQMESCIVFGLTMAMYGEVTFDKGRVQQTNFHNYPMMRMNDCPPKIDVFIVESTAEMGGAGEPGVPPTAPALANALFKATGKRLRTTPLNSVNMKSA